MKEETKTRRLKVYSAQREKQKRPHPFIRLAGFYLSNFNFKIGDKVEVTLDANQITITKIMSALLFGRFFFIFSLGFLYRAFYIMVA